MTTTSSIAPAVHGPDAAILEAFQTIRRLRARNYSFDDAPEDLPQDQYDANDNEMQAAEAVIWTTQATTVEAVSARLLLAVTTMEQSRWVDRTLMEEGWQALLSDKGDMSGDAAQILNAVNDLAHISWQRAVAEQGAAYRRYEAFGRIRGLIDAARFSGKCDAETGEEIVRFIDEVEDQFSDHKSLLNLVATPAPNWSAYQVKSEITLREGYAEEAAPHLARDVQQLTGLKPEGTHVARANGRGV